MRRTFRAQPRPSGNPNQHLPDRSASSRGSAQVLSRIQRYTRVEESLPWRYRPEGRWRHYCCWHRHRSLRLQSTSRARRPAPRTTVSSPANLRKEMCARAEPRFRTRCTSAPPWHTGPMGKGLPSFRSACGPHAKTSPRTKPRHAQWRRGGLTHPRCAGRDPAARMVAYTATGSSTGKNSAKYHAVDFAGSDSLLKAADYASHPDIQARRLLFCPGNP